MLDFDWNQMRTSIPAQTRVTAGQVKIASAPIQQRRKHILARYGRSVMTLTFLIIASSLLTSFALHTVATSTSYKVQLAKLECANQLERNSRLQMALDDLVANQNSAQKLGLSEFSTPERISIGGK
jgi:hypothetical protein